MKHQKCFVSESKSRKHFQNDYVYVDCKLKLKSTNISIYINKSHENFDKKKKKNSVTNHILTNSTLISAIMMR